VQYAACRVRPASFGYVFAPDGTKDKVTRFRSWVGRKGRIGAAVIATWPIVRGLITLL
jgi:hypothetical protein